MGGSSGGLLCDYDYLNKNQRWYGYAYDVSTTDVPGTGKPLKHDITMKRYWVGYEKLRYFDLTIAGNAGLITVTLTITIWFIKSGTVTSDFYSYSISCNQATSHQNAELKWNVTNISCPTGVPDEINKKKYGLGGVQESGLVTNHNR